MKVGVIGSGRFGRNHVKTLQEMGVLAAVAEVDDSARQSVEAEYQIPTFRDYREMLAQDVDAVVVATPASSHFSITKDVLQAKRPVLVEKPLTLDIEEGKSLVEIAGKAGVTLMVGHLLLYQPAIQWIKKALDEGFIGELQSLHQERLNLGKARNQENALWSLGVHDVATALYLVDSNPYKVISRGLSSISPGVEDDVYLHIDFENKVQAHLHCSWLWPELSRKLVLIGNKGMLVFDEKLNHVIFHKKSIDAQLNNSDEGTEVVFQGSEPPLRLELEHFLDCTKTGKKPKSDGVSAVKVLEVLKKAESHDHA